MARLTTDQAHSIALSRYREGSLTSASGLCSQILAHEPEHVGSLTLLGMIEGHRGNHKKSLRLFRSASSLKPDSPQIRTNLGEAYRRMGQPHKALKELNTALSLQPENGGARNVLGLVYRQIGDLSSAAASFQAALRCNPDDVTARRNLGGALLESGEIDGAVEILGEIRTRGQADANTLTQLGTALTGQGDEDGAITAFGEALQKNPRHVRAHDNLATLLIRRGEISEALEHYRTAVTIDPRDASSHNNLASALIKCGLTDDALEHYRKALDVKPDLESTWDSLLYYLPYSSSETPESIARAFAQWRRHAIDDTPAVTWRFPNTLSPDRRLRIGYVSPDFRNHVVARFILPFLRNHDRESFEIFCYSTSSFEDPTTSECRSLSDHWRDISRTSDDAAVNTITNDRIDILVDLAMHSKGNRLKLFAKKPAPVQATYLANVSTTGLGAVDYRITDPFLDPGDWRDPAFSEESMRLPRIYGCYTPEAEPHISEPPCLTNGFVTFGCLNNYCKINERVLEVWARIMRKTPDSLLFLLAPDGEARRRTKELMERNGISPDRLSLTSGIPKDEYLDAYNRIDIALDPFPYQGITTTFDALWMGCPVVSHVGRRGTERVALSLLSNLGHPELVGDDLENYVTTAVELAHDPDRIRFLRFHLRDEMKRSALMDGTGLTRELETLYRTMWELWTGERTSDDPSQRR